MHHPKHMLTLLPILCSTLVVADYLGPRYPYPTDLSSNESLVAASWKNLTSTLKSLLNDDNITTSSEGSVLSAFKNVTFSVGIFSPNDADAATADSVQFHYTSPQVSNSQYGTNEVNGDTVYRIASITKLVTAYAGLLNLKSSDWERPLIDFFPQLKAMSEPDDLTRHVQWDKVTVWALASQISGVPRDAYGWSPNEDTLAVPNATKLIAIGFPPLTPQDPIYASTCAYSENVTSCGLNFTNYIKSIKPRPATFLPFTSPAYANDGYLLLGQIFEKIIGKPIEEIYRDSIFDPLSMNKSSAVSPPKSEWPGCAIPGKTGLSDFQTDVPIARSSGGVFSSLHELAKMGISILNYTLLSREKTHQWMKPTTHTDRLEFSVGAPWEIVRYTHPKSGVVTDIYCKSGDSGAYSSFLCIMPDFDVGFTILGTSTDAVRPIVVGEIGDLVIEALLPGLMAQSINEAERRFGGVYESTTKGLNTSLTLSLNKTEGAPAGLAISRFISNGTDVIANSLVPGRLQPTIVDPAMGKVAFRAVAADLPSSKPLGLLADLTSLSWVGAGAQTYGNLDTDLFVFDLNERGRAVAVSPVAFRVKLERREG